jgi:hypothetical protein
VSSVQDEGKDLRKTQSKARRDTNLIRLARIQRPDAMHGQQHDNDVSNGVGRDQGLDHWHVLSTLSLRRPLGGNGVAKEDAGAQVGNHPHQDEAEGDLGSELHPRRDEDADEEEQHACLDGGKEDRVDDLHPKGQLLHVSEVWALVVIARVVAGYYLEDIGNIGRH